MHERAPARGQLTLSDVRISVVIPMYRSAAYIADCLRSVLDQRLPVEEIVLVDDCTDDDSIEVARRVLDTSRVPYSVLRQPSNLGAGPARNAGVAVTTGNVIWFFDSDDLADPSFTTEMVAALIAHDADFVTCRTSFVEADGAPIGTVEPHFVRPAVSGREFAGMLIDGRVKAYPTPRLFRRDILGETPWDQRRAYEDMAATARLALRSRTVAMVDSPLMSYRQHPTSTSQVVRPHTRDVFAMADDMDPLIRSLVGGREGRRLARRFRYREALIPAGHLAMRAQHDKSADHAIIKDLLDESRTRSRLKDVYPLLWDRQFRSAAFAFAINMAPTAYSAVLRRR